MNTNETHTPATTFADDLRAAMDIWDKINATIRAEIPGIPAAEVYELAAAAFRELILAPAAPKI